MNSILVNLDRIFEQQNGDSLSHIFEELSAWFDFNDPRIRPLEKQLHLLIKKVLGSTPIKTKQAEGTPLRGQDVMIGTVLGDTIVDSFVAPFVLQGGPWDLETGRNYML